MFVFGGSCEGKIFLDRMFIFIGNWPMMDKFLNDKYEKIRLTVYVLARRKFFLTDCIIKKHFSYSVVLKTYKSIKTPWSIIFTITTLSYIASMRKQKYNET
jgi:hypothetical protein